MSGKPRVVVNVGDVYLGLLIRGIDHRRDNRGNFIYRLNFDCPGCGRNCWIIRPAIAERVRKKGEFRCRECWNERAGHDFEKICLTRRYREYESHARQLCRDFDLDLDEFRAFVLGHCHYCGSVPRSKGKSAGVNAKRFGEQTFMMNGIDRIDNNIGYVSGNMITCCKRCNIMKGSLSYEEFLGHTFAIVEHAMKRML